MASEKDSVDTRCTTEECIAKEVFELPPIQSQLLLEAYNRLHSDRPLQGKVYQIYRMDESCTTCNHRLDIQEQNYCIRVEPEKDYSKPSP